MFLVVTTSAGSLTPENGSLYHLSAAEPPTQDFDGVDRGSEKGSDKSSDGDISRDFSVRRRSSKAGVEVDSEDIELSGKTTNFQNRGYTILKPY